MRSIFTFSIVFLLLKGILLSDATPPCFRELEISFFNRKAVIEALSYTEIQAGVWELIAADLRAKNPLIHQEVRGLARLKKRDPTEHPFQMRQAKEILERVLFTHLQETMRTYKYNFIRENDIARVFNFLKSAQQTNWDLCR